MRIVQLGVVLGAFLASSVSAQDDNGADRFKQVCGQCHAVVEGENRLGPSLYDIVGRDAGSIEGFRYSRAMRETDVVWTPENIDAFVQAPHEFMPGTKMAFTGIQDEAERTAIIDYLISQGEAPDDDMSTDG